MIRLPNTRIIFALIVAFSIASIVFALIMEHVFGMDPCPLCITQRIFIIAVGIVALPAAIFGKYPKLHLLCAPIAAVLAIIGGSVSARHVWIQSLPEDEQPICGPSLEYMFDTRPMFEALDLLFKGDGHCADINMMFLGLSFPGWTLVAFLGLAICLIWLFIRTLKLPKNL